jgi:hypothetical protein
MLLQFYVSVSSAVSYIAIVARVAGMLSSGAGAQYCSCSIDSSSVPVTKL